MIALITGASGGIGYCIARELATKGYDIILVGIEQEELEKKSKQLEEDFGIKTYIINQNLAQNGAGQIVYNKVKELGLKLDILVNNAGFGTFGDFVQTDYKWQKSLLDVNVGAVVELCHLFGKDMCDKNRGYILNVASIAGYTAGPYMTMYYASKAFVLSFSEGLHEELKKHNVKVCALCPGPTATNFEKNAKMMNSDMFKKLKVSTPEFVAKVGVDALFKNKAICVAGFSNKCITTFSKIFPRKVARNSAKHINIGKDNK